MINGFTKEYSFLSNFYNVHVVYDGISYSSTEAAFQAAKTFDTTARKKIALMSPANAKAAGKKLALRDDWEDVKDTIMYEVCLAKFEQNAAIGLDEQLLATGTEELVETNTWHDNYWGNCTCDQCKDIPGRNQLGKTLMRIRKELQEKKAKQ